MQMRLRTLGLAGLLILLHGVMAWSVSPRIGVTADEPVHIVSGLYYWQTGDFRFQPENGNLPQRLSALPWVLAGVNVPATEGPAWDRADIWALGHKLLTDAGPKRTALLAASRGMNVLLGCCLLVVIFEWATGLWGHRAGLVALAVAAFCPNLLAHAGLATSDTAGALSFLVAVMAAWRLNHRVTMGRVLQAGLGAGLLAVAKFSAVLLPVVVAGLLIVRLCRGAALPWSLPAVGCGRLKKRSRQAIALAGAWLASAVLAWVVVWSAYGFRYAASPRGGAFMKSWDTVLITEPQKLGLPQLGEPLENCQVDVRAGALQATVRWARDHRVLPEAWLYGLSFVAYHSHSRLGFFNGDYGTTGSWLYFPAAWWWKSTPAGMLLLAAGVMSITLGRGRGRRWYRLAPLLILGAVYGGVSMAGSLNIGLRHELPLIAASWILAGAVARRDGFWRWRSGRLTATAGLCIVIGAHVAESVRTRPDYLAYFNGLAGPEAHRHRLLVDSNLDWGQGLPALASWVRDHARDRPVYLSYFGSDDVLFYPELSGVIRWGDLPFSRHPRALPTLLGPGLYAFGATQFQRAYSVVRGPWTGQREALYQELHTWLREQNARPSGTPLTTRRGRVLSLEETTLALSDYDALTLGRITQGLQNHRPVAALGGGAVLVFEIDAALLEQLTGVH
jgi:hypothetical protein